MLSHNLHAGGSGMDERLDSNRFTKVKPRGYGSHGIRLILSSAQVFLQF
jgi:hypothetical protein